MIAFTTISRFKFWQLPVSVGLCEIFEGRNNSWMHKSLKQTRIRCNHVIRFSVSAFSYWNAFFTNLAVWKAGFENSAVSKSWLCCFLKNAAVASPDCIAVYVVCCRCSIVFYAYVNCATLEWWRPSAFGVLDIRSGTCLQNLLIAIESWALELDHRLRRTVRERPLRSARLFLVMLISSWEKPKSFWR